MKKTLLATAVTLAATLLTSHVVQADDIGQVITDGKVFGDFRLRYEANDTDNALKTADALTLRSRIGVESGSFAGFSVLVEGVNTTAIIDDYSPERANYNGVADPEDSAFNRVQITYQDEGFKAVVGRQRIIFDNARHVGNVAWRQHEQTYDAARIGYQEGNFSFDYAYIDQVNVFTFTNYDAAHHLLNVGYNTSIGKLTGYGYLLSNQDNANKNAGDNSDTFGVRLAGKQALDSFDVFYTAEAARQTTEDYTAWYALGEIGAKVSAVTVMLGYESLGSDDKAYSFQTPLATKHAFNGWADKFGVTPADGLNDAYVSIGTKVAGVNLVAVYHDYHAAKGGNDYGDEINLQATMGINKYLSAGLKYAAYSKGDAFEDTDKAFAWLEAKF